MDFKVTGTSKGITACQMDIKIKGLSYEILIKALEQARVGRLHILDKLIKTINQPNDSVKAHAPKIIKLTIPNEFIGAVIGPGGKVIQEMQKETDTTIVIEENGDDGVIEILGVNQEKIDAVIDRINNITFKPKAGEIYNVNVVKVLDFGAVVEFVPGNEVLLHISEISWDRIDKVTDEINLGDTFDVKYFGIDPKTRKPKVSRKALLPRPKKK
jgi:polyribonucleotide nucleotidyltransferase